MLINLLMNVKKLLSAFTLIFISIIISRAQNGFNKGKLDSLLNNVAENNKAMLSLAISQDGKIVYQKAIGYAFLAADKKIPADIKTKYRIGSITKVFTGVMILQLIEEGKLGFATPLSNFYPQLPNAAKITIAQMLQHRSGLHNYTSDSVYTTYMRKYQTEQQMLDVFAKQSSDFEPDSKFSYSNTNFYILGCIIEKITHQTYPEALQQRIIKKIGLPDTYYSKYINTANHEAWSYKYMNGGWQPDTEGDASVIGGAGALGSTPADLDKFIEALFAGKLIGASSLWLMQTMKDGYGMAMFSVNLKGKIGYGHNGAVDGFGSEVMYFPADKTTIAYAYNGDAGGAGKTFEGAAAIYFNQPYTIPSFKMLALKSEDLDKYLGVYASPGFPLKITITKNSTILMAQATGQGAFDLNATEPNVFEYDPGGIVMEFDAAKNTMVLKQAGHTTIFTKEK